MPTPLRLIVDLARRRWRAGLFWLFIYAYNMAGAFRIKELGLAPDSLVLGAFVIAFVLTVTGASFATRVHYQLPLSRRAWWRTLWILRVGCVSPIVGFVVGLRASDTFRPVWSSRSVVYAVTLSIFASVVIRSRSLRETIMRALRPGLLTLPVTLFFLIAPFFAAPYFPHTFADFNVWWIMAYGALAFYGAGGFFEDPPIVARPAPRPSIRAAASPLNFTSADAPVSDRLTGLRLDLYLRGRRRLMGLGVAVAGMAIIWATMSVFRPVPSLPQSLIALGVLPFVEPRLDLAYFAISLILVVVLLADAGGLRLNVVAMRTAPISTWRLSTLPIVTGTATAAMIYASQLGAYVLTGHLHVDLWRIDLFIVAAALVGLIDMLGLFTGRNFGLLVLVLFAIPLFRTDLDMILPESTYLYAGCALLAFTWFASWYLVARSTYGYRRVRLRGAALGADTLL